GPRGADLHEVVGEGARRAAAVAAVDDADVLGGQADAGVERLERRVVPLGDVAHEHLGDGVTVELQGRGAQLGDVVGDGDGARGGGELDDVGGVGQLRVAHGRVAAREVHEVLGDVAAALARAAAG